MSIKGMVSSRDIKSDNTRSTTNNFVKELLDALAEMMDKKIHLENENLELKHKCQAQKQKIDAFKELALGEKAFLLGIIKREYSSTFPSKQEGLNCNKQQEFSVKDDENLKIDRKASITSSGEKSECILQNSDDRMNAMGVDCSSRGSAKHSSEDATIARSMTNNGNSITSHDAGITKPFNVDVNSTNDQPNETEEIGEFKKLQKLIQQHITDAKLREETLLTNVQRLEQHLKKLENRCDFMQDKLNEIQAEQKMLKFKTKVKETIDMTTLKGQEKEAQTDRKLAKKVCKCGGLMTQKEEQILSELFFQRF